MKVRKFRITPLNSIGNTQSKMLSRILLVVALLLIQSIQVNARAESATLAAPVYIVDDTSPDFQKFGPASGWVSEQGAWQDFYNGGETWTHNTINQVVNSAHWLAPELSVTSVVSYEVFAFIPRIRSNTITATYQIVHQGITESVVVNQNTFAAEWVALGSYAFDASGNRWGNRVVLSDMTGEPANSRIVGFDAMAFVLKSNANGLANYLPMMSKPNDDIPEFTTSRYMSTIDGQKMYQLGCKSGEKRESGVVVLDFGQPRLISSTVGASTVVTYGTRIFDFTFVSLNQIADGAKQFANGYWSCAPKDTQLRLALGTSNYESPTHPSFADANGWQEHGRAFAQMVNDVHAWLQTQPNLASQIFIFGANDIEPSWNSVANSRAWVDGYASVSQRSFYNYGSCDGCPNQFGPLWSPNNGWSVDDVWYVSWGAQPALPMPEIYAQSSVNADQWYRISLHGALKHNQKIEFDVVLTQWQACNRDPETFRSCLNATTANKPEDGWRQMMFYLNADPRTTHTVQFSSDISWEN